MTIERERLRPGRERTASAPQRRPPRLPDLHAPAPGAGPDRPERDRHERDRHERDRPERDRPRPDRRRPPAPRIRADRSLRLALASTAVLTIGTIFGAAIFHVLLVQSEFRLNRLNRQIATEQARYEQLRLDVARLSAPDRIVADAQSRLGMVIPPQVTYIVAPAAASAPGAVAAGPAAAGPGAKPATPPSASAGASHGAPSPTPSAGPSGAPRPGAGAAGGAPTAGDDPSDPAAPSLEGGWSKVKAQLGPRP